MKQPDWIATRNALPSDGESVEFRVAERLCPLRGTFHFGRFCSKWIGYVPPVVSEWRELSAALADGCLALDDRSVSPSLSAAHWGGTGDGRLAGMHDWAAGAS